MIKPWQRFQQNYEKSCVKDGVWYYRLKDCPKDFNNPNPNIRFTPSNTCDYIAFSPALGILFPTELKSFVGKSFSFGNMNEDHEDKMVAWENEYANVHPCIMFEFRDLGESYLVPIGLYHDYKLCTDRKSIGIQTVRDIGVLVRSKQLKVNYRYFIQEAYERMVA